MWAVIVLRPAEVHSGSRPVDRPPVGLVMLPAFVGLLAVDAVSGVVGPTGTLAGVALIVWGSARLLPLRWAWAVAVLGWALVHGADLGEPGQLGWTTASDLPRLALLLVVGCIPAVTRSWRR